MKIKLPRKRKKAMIKAEGVWCYFAECVSNEWCKEEGRPKHEWYKFRKLKVNATKRKVDTIGYY